MYALTVAHQGEFRCHISRQLRRNFHSWRKCRSSCRLMNQLNGARLSILWLREFHPIPSVDHTLSQLSRAKYLSKLDANWGFWQVGLFPESAKLTTFITPFGRFCFNSVLLGILTVNRNISRNGWTKYLREHSVSCTFLMTFLFMDRHLKNMIRLISTWIRILYNVSASLPKPQSSLWATLWTLMV